MFGSLFGSLLKLLGIGERRVITSLKSTDSFLVDKLRDMELLPGTQITLEQRLHRFNYQGWTEALSTSTEWHISGFPDLRQ